MASRVVHFEIQADDVNRAKNFYEKALGWEITPAMTKEQGGMDYWSVKTGPEGTPGINGGLYERPTDRKLFTYDCTIMVDNLDKSIKAVKENGGKITTEKMEIPGVGWLVSGLDTEGNKFGLMQPTEWQPK